MITSKEQAPDAIVDVATLLRGFEDYPVYPEGARAKGSFIWPETSSPSYPFCIPSRRYMFKLSRRVYPQQFWMEIFAYHLGCLIGVNVPPAFVAYDSEANQAGALIEWFYNEEEDSYLRGGDIMQSLIEGYDKKKGLQHNLQTIFDYLQTVAWGKEDWMRDWAKMLTFDALIGNSDRHQDNWGIVTQKGRIFKEDVIHQMVMSPAFDNGTSMAIEIQEEAFAEFKMPAYVERGQPHLQWDLAQVRKHRENQVQFIARFAQTYPHLKETMRHCLQFSRESVEKIVNYLTSFKISPGLSPARARFMVELLSYRQQRLLSVLA